MSHQELIEKLRETLEKGSTEQILEVFDLFRDRETSDNNGEIILYTGMMWDDNNEIVDWEL
jgi:hypothetical protein